MVGLGYNDGMQEFVFPRLVDRIVLRIIGSQQIVGGLYLLLLPLELGDLPDSTIAHAITAKAAIVILGLLAVGDGVFMWIGTRKKARVTTLKWSLFLSFMIRLYGALGAIVAQGSWLPPSYLTAFVLAGIVGTYYV